ncbi:ureidoglycolate lyase [Mesorhizobium sp. WSM4887]|uniref:ureidoglycolate lyase n=1 Tax=Mesorhizobium sp. WSM4887 TaxID=3038543 RepID=UPI0024159F4A|nr:ureidoglycolate lyase [Mesorhizobium sp. WSM4887]MDG4889764.1 ureidoglycolate lyase [Mesorhizobium sp. WSM4887]
MTLLVRAAEGYSQEAFAHYGSFVERPDEYGTRRHYGEWLGGAVDGLSPQMHVNAVPRSQFPLTVSQVERHPHAAQIFLPLQASRYMVTVMPANAAGAPQVDAAVSFIVPGHIGVIYKAGIWHVGASAIDRDANFAVLMWRGSEDDDEFLRVNPFKIVAENTTSFLLEPAKP